MSYRSLASCVRDLERNGHLVRIADELSPELVIPLIQRRAYEQGAPALLFERLEGSPFPALANLYGTMERCRFLFRHTLERVQRLVQLKVDPRRALKNPGRYLRVPTTALWSLPRRVRSGPVLQGETTIDALPAIRSWPRDGGPFITLPQVLSTPPDGLHPMKANLGMYRVQLSGNEYRTNEEIGLHFQIQRGIANHYAAWRDREEAMPVSIFVGGPPSHSFSAVMPLPEGMSELLFAGLLGGRRFRYAVVGDHLVSTDADFCILGRVRPGATKPEGPFGDHLGYYSLQHDFPVVEVERVLHRKDAIWPFTVVGRPPQEDTSFGELIHEITGELVPDEIPGVREMHAVDAAGVHPLLLAIAEERYVPYEERKPREILRIANALLGFGQASLAKYLVIAAEGDEPGLDTHDLPAFFQHVLRRVDWRRDLHFQTRTTIDTLDYSGSGLNEGSKLVIAAAGPACRELATTPPPGVLPGRLTVPLPGILAIDGLPEATGRGMDDALRSLREELERRQDELAGFPLVTMVDDAGFVAERFANWLWVVFTRSDPAADVHGLGEELRDKHWGCRGSLLIDARRKPHHAPPLEDDPDTIRRVEELASRGGPLHGII